MRAPVSAHSLARCLAAAAVLALCAGCTVVTGVEGVSYRNARNQGEALHQSAKPVPRAVDKWQADKDLFIGVAISGGGSRSANFGMAALAELDALGILEHVDADLGGQRRLDPDRAVRARRRPARLGRARPRQGRHRHAAAAGRPAAQPGQRAGHHLHRPRPQRHHGRDLRGQALRRPARALRRPRRARADAPGDLLQRHRQHRRRPPLRLHRGELRAPRLRARRLPAGLGDGSVGRLSRRLQLGDAAPPPAGRLGAARRGALPAPDRRRRVRQPRRRDADREGACAAHLGAAPESASRAAA